jgi:hypothetical protein
MPAPDPSEDEEQEEIQARALGETLGVEVVVRRLGPVAPALEGAADQVGDVPSGDALEELYARARAAALRTMGGPPTR